MSDIKLKPHQQTAVDFMDHNYGLILYHSTGSGKTITSLVAMYKFNKPIIIIGPKSARKAFEDEIKELGYDRSRFTMYSFAKIKNERFTDGYPFFQSQYKICPLMSI